MSDYHSVSSRSIRLNSTQNLRKKNDCHSTANLRLQKQLLLKANKFSKEPTGIPVAACKERRGVQFVVENSRSPRNRIKFITAKTPVWRSSICRRTKTP